VHSAASTVALDIAENALSLVVFGTVAFSLVMCLLILFTRGSGSMYDQIGHGGLTSEADYGGGTLTPAPDSAAGRAEREQEVRQMLRARSDRLVRNGQPALDVDAEVARLLEPARLPSGHEPGLIDEVRQLVVARNERRARQGLGPLDVEAEVTRTLDELDP